MNLTEYITEVIDGEQTSVRFLTFRTDRLKMDKAQEVIKAIGPYNGFNPGLVNEVLSQIADKYGPLSIEVGREGSPCLYVWTNDYAKLDDIKEMLSAAHPDELGRETGYSVRAWWD